ncbi:MAG: GTP-binding protein HSR1-related protein [Promethearchaeota archaeon CR_4]|nr:MAG: GTP-binding protein HSR1-related protein [Candidatus Lokiarchaeota archaeon CR_4]
MSHKTPQGGDSLPKIVLVGNSNVGKSSITTYLLKGVHSYVGKIGKHPGTTLKIRPLVMPQNYEIVDMPGLGYMASKGRGLTKHVWDIIIHYLEQNAKLVRMAFIVVSIENFRRNVEKWEVVQIPIDMEMTEFLRELGIPFKIIANKIDKIPLLAVKDNLAMIAEKMQVPPSDIFPVSAKLGKGLKEVKDFVGSFFK